MNLFFFETNLQSSLNDPEVVKRAHHHLQLLAHSLPNSKVEGQLSQTVLAQVYCGLKFHRDGIQHTYRDDYILLVDLIEITRVFGNQGNSYRNVWGRPAPPMTIEAILAEDAQSKIFFNIFLFSLW